MKIIHYYNHVDAQWNKINLGKCDLFTNKVKHLIIYEMVKMILTFICKNKHMRLARKLDETKEIE